MKLIKNILFVGLINPNNNEIKILNRLVSSIVVLVFTVGFFGAQDIRFGTKGKLNLASVNVDGESGQRASFHFGGGNEIALKPEAGLNYKINGIQRALDFNCRLFLGLGDLDKQANAFKLDLRCAFDYIKLIFQNTF